MPVESKIVTILDNVLWTTNSPQIFLSMYYTVRKDGEIILNRGKDTYTFEHITLVVSMPNRGSFYGYTVGARIFSGNYSTEQIWLKSNTPSYWSEYKYDFGNLVVKDVDDNQEALPIYLQMYSDAPGQYTTKQYKVVDDYGVIYDKEVTDTGARTIRDNLGRNVSINFQNLASAIETVKKRKISYTYLPDDPQKYPEVEKIYSWAISAISDPSLGFFRVIKKTVKVSEHQEFVRSIVTDIPDRDGQIYGKDNFSIGSLYHLPEISYISLPKIGGYAISCQSEYFTRYSDAINQSDWRWHSELFVLQDGDYVRVQSDNNGPPIYTYSKTFYGLNPSKQYKITVKFGGNGDYTQTLYKIIPPRQGIYVYSNGKWNYCISMVGKKGEENIGTFQEYFWQSIGEKVVKTVFDDGTLYGGIESAQVTQDE